MRENRSAYVANEYFSSAEGRRHAEQARADWRAMLAQREQRRAIRTARRDKALRLISSPSAGFLAIMAGSIGSAVARVFGS